jgi:hypothetical protein
MEQTLTHIPYPDVNDDKNEQQGRDTLKWKNQNTEAFINML